MKKIILDCRDITDREALYDRIAAVFSFPAYFGRNLDALYDCLTETAEDTCVGLFLPVPPLPAQTAVFSEEEIALPEPDGARGLDGHIVTPEQHNAGRPDGDPSRTAQNDFTAYLEKVRRTFEDAEEDNPHLCVIVC